MAAKLLVFVSSCTQLEPVERRVFCGLEGNCSLVPHFLLVKDCCNAQAKEGQRNRVKCVIVI